MRFQLFALLPCLAISLARAPAQEPRSDESALANVLGSVYDSLAGKPLAGALVQLIARDGAAQVRSAQSNAEGTFEVSKLAHGSYLVGFMHPILDSLGLDVPPQLLQVFDDSVVHTALAIPSAPTIRSQICPRSRQPEDSTGLVMGFIRDASSGMPLDSAAVLLTWTDLVAARKDVRANRRQLEVRARSDGWYAICGAPAESPITARAQRGESHTGDVEVVVPPRGLLHRDFSIPVVSTSIAASDAPEKSTAAFTRRGTARLTGIVRNEQGKPLGGALLLIRGAGISATSEVDGSFSLSSLPAGTQTLEVRYVGYTPKHTIVDLVSDEARSIEITLDDRTEVLDEVTVYGKAGRQRREINAFLERRRRGLGHFITRAEIEEQHVMLFTDVFRTVPGLRVVHRALPDDYTIALTRGAAGQCEPQLYVDGTRLIDAKHINSLLRPGDIAGVEIYSASEAPPEYQSAECGTVLIWMGPDLGSIRR